jgi:ribonuclease P protein component
MNGVKGDRNIRKVLSSKKKNREIGLTVGFSNLDKDHNTYLIIISKKIYKKANKRNKLRRRIKAILINHQELYKNYNSILVQVKDKSLLYITYQELEKNLLDSFYKLI